MNNLDNDKKVMRFGYEDTDKKIEIDLYGLKFEINNIGNIEELKNMNKSDLNTIESQLEKVLGDGAIEKINNKRLADGYSKLNIDIELNIFGCIFEAYSNTMVDNMTNKITGTVNNISDKMNEMSNFGNREQRRNYNRNNRGYNRNRSYRRY